MLLYSIAADLHQSLPPSVGNLSLFIQILQHKRRQLSWVHNKRVWSQIPFAERAICYPIHLRRIYGAIYCCPVMGEECGRCVIISALMKEKWNLIVGEKSAIITKKNEDCTEKTMGAIEKKCIMILFLNIHLYELQLRFIFINRRCFALILETSIWNLLHFNYFLPCLGYRCCDYPWKSITLEIYAKLS